MRKKTLAMILLSAAFVGSVISCSTVHHEEASNENESGIATQKPPGTPADVAPIIWETKAQHDARMKWWREARFGMFIHWGVYCVLAGEFNGQPEKGAGEWIMNNMKIPVATYASYTKKFNPVKFNADEWVQTAKNAGMQYIVITAKHHDGFAMFHTHTDGYNIFDATPFHRDPLAELAAACRKYNMKLGFYYSESQDWHHPGGTALHGGHWDHAQDGSMDQYLKTIAIPQVHELLTNYGDVAVIWWDTPAEMTHERASWFLPLYSLQPPLITNNRLIHNDPKIPGDYETPEQYIPATGYPGRDWETCMTMNGTWGFKASDHNWKSTQTLLHNLIDISSKGGNYLLNIGPTSLGTFPDASIERLKQIGQWMDINGQAIHDTTASPFRHYTWDGRATVHGNTLYIHVFKWPADGIRIEGLTTKIKSARVLRGDQTIFGGEIPVPFNVESDGAVTIAKPAHLPTIESTDQTNSDSEEAKHDEGPLPTVIALELDGLPQVDNSRFATHAADDGSITLTAKSAGIAGSRAHYESDGDYIGNWKNKRDSVYWDILPKSAGDYNIEFTYSCADDDAGSHVRISAGQAHVDTAIQGTGGWDNFKTIQLGPIHLDGSIQAVVAESQDMAKSAVMDLKSVKLTPVQ